MDDPVYEAMKRVDPFESFLEFMRVLECDFLKNGGSWENQSIDSFIEASAAWAKDWSDDQLHPEIKNPTWQNFANILSAGIIYE